MPSPFPGMNPYLESHSIWQDFHSNLAIEIQKQVNSQIRPDYVAILDPYMVYDEIVIGKPPYGIKPDVGVFQVKEVATMPYQVATKIDHAPHVAQVTAQVPTKVFTVKIKHLANDSLVTVIEILSPINKRAGDGFEKYNRKRLELQRSFTNLLEIDLLRTGKRFPTLTPLPEALYYAFLHEGEGSPNLQVWPMTIDKRLPVLPVPLLDLVPPASLDLQAALHVIYDRAAYDLRIDYTQPPDPPLEGEMAQWMETFFKERPARSEKNDE